MKHFNNDAGRKGWRKTSDYTPEYKHAVEGYDGEYAFVWVIEGSEAKSAIYHNGEYRINGRRVEPQYFMRYEECEDTRPNIKHIL